MHTGRVFEVQPERRVMKSGTWQDEAGEANAFTILDKPRPEPLIHSTFWTHRLAVSRLPEAAQTRSPDTEWDLIGRDRDYTQPRAPRTGGERQRKTKKITVVHNMQGKTPDLLSRKTARLRQWNKPGLTGVRQSSCSRQNQAGPT